MGIIHRLASHTKHQLKPKYEGICSNNRELISFYQLPNHLPICRYCRTRICWTWIWCSPIWSLWRLPICRWISSSCCPSRSQGSKGRSNSPCSPSPCCSPSVYIQSNCCPSTSPNKPIPIVSFKLSTTLLTVLDSVSKQQTCQLPQ